MKETARFMLGRAWPTENKQAAAQFQAEFQVFVAEAVTHSLRSIPAVALEVKGSHRRTDGSTLVWSNLNLPSGEALPVDWQLAQNPADGTFQITDIAVAGIQATFLLRTMAAAVLGDGETVQGLIPRLRAALGQRTGGTTTANPTVTTP